MIRRNVSIKRWLANPWQCLVILHITLWGILTLWLGPWPPESIIYDLNKETRFWYAIANVVGGVVCLIALLMRDQVRAEWIELSGNISLGAASMTYIYLLIDKYGLPNTTFSYFLANAIFWSALARSVQILYWKANPKEVRDYVAEVKAEVAEEIQDDDL